ncbi:hypothetical protein [Haloplanus salilacus]|uniref:hypothetical protein n=1 Tax=Haloplanus salilacus TaxID=2949994 RepID=UPI0030D1DBE9
MPISKDELHPIDKGEPPHSGLAPDTTQGAVYRFLLEHANQAFRQQEFVDAVDVPERSVGPTLERLEEHGLVKQRDRFWTVADAEHTVASAEIGHRRVHRTGHVGYNVQLGQLGASNSA